MRLLVLGATCLMLPMVACERPSASPEATKATAPATGKPASDSMAKAAEIAKAEDVALPGAIYKNAYDKAAKEIDASNARERLRALERAIDRERQALP